MSANILPLLRERERLSVRQLDTSMLPDYRIVRADTPEYLEACFRLRYQVYCVENRFEETAENPLGLESDGYESQSLHALVLHRQSNVPVATVRLILPAMASAPPLPFLNFCAQPIVADTRRFPLNHVAEISRFAISKLSRNACGPVSPKSKNSSENDRVKSAIANREATTVALVRAFLWLAAQNDIHILCALMEKCLIRRAKLLGIRFDPVGSPVDHHGLRQPCITVITDLLDNAKRMRPDVWDALTDGGSLSSAFRPYDISV